MDRVKACLRQLRLNDESPLKPQKQVSFGLSGDDDDGDASEKDSTLTTQRHSLASRLATAAPVSSGRMKPVPSLNTLNRLERQELVLHKKPLETLKFGALELFCLIRENLLRLWHHRAAVFLLSVIVMLSCFLYSLPGHHQQILRLLEKKLFWCAYWLGLGVLSSIGFGTGLHTFLLYLGPHIASVTMAAFECGSLKFPEPPYPDKIICPDAVAVAGAAGALNATLTGFQSAANGLPAISIWNIMSKVRLESIMWGAGTALGELPPYFMARAARISGQEPDDEEYREFKQFLELNSAHKAEVGLADRLKLLIERMVEKVGFFAILLCASIPNPLFDLAGITCGHFLIPFWTFFGSTLIGKAIVKTHIQQLFVIIAFSKHHCDSLLNVLVKVPKIGVYLERPLRDFLDQQKVKLHGTMPATAQEKSSIVQLIIEGIVELMIFTFLVSLFNSLAQRYHRRLWERRKREMLAEHQTECKNN